MMTLKELTNEDPRAVAVTLAGLSWSMVHTARIALENQTSGQPVVDAACNVLEFAEELIGHVHEATELFEIETKRGPCRPLSKVAAT